MKLLPVLMLSSSFAIAAEQTLWPSESEWKVTPHDKSKLVFLPNKAVEAKIVPGYDWPGLTVEHAGGPVDWSQGGLVEVVVSNTCAKTLKIHACVKASIIQGAEPGMNVDVKPGEIAAKTIRLGAMPWVLDKPLELVAMRGKPTNLPGGSFNLKEVISVHVFLCDKNTEASFALLSMKLKPSQKKTKTLDAATFLPFVDEFGQFKHDDWPGKVHDETELKKSKKTEDAWLATHTTSPIQGADKFGGWGTGPQLKATRFFRVEKVKGKWWLVDPEGRLFFSQGIDCVIAGQATPVGERESYFAWLPEKDDATFKDCWGKGWGSPLGYYKDKKGYSTFDFAKANLMRKYGPGWFDEFKNRAHLRIKAWGLNTIANWSNKEVYLQKKTPYTVCIGSWGAKPIAGSNGHWGKFPDPFSSEFVKAINDRAREQEQTTANDSWCIGYFCDNEMSWGNDDMALARDALTSPQDQPAKIAAKDELARRYKDVSALNAAWGTQYADWNALLSSTDLPEVDRARKDLEAIHLMIAEEYYRIVRNALRTHVPNHLYLGSRIAWGAPSVYIAAAKYCDVVSVNIYNFGPNRALPAEMQDRPMINGEFHFGALDRGMFHTGLVPVGNQIDRAEKYKAYVTACLKDPRYVGTHWFQWQDQALTGRNDGENYQIGFVNVADIPYPEMVDAAREVAATMYKTRFDN